MQNTVIRRIKIANDKFLHLIKAVPEKSLTFVPEMLFDNLLEVYRKRCLSLKTGNG
jgi:hypothetical protein